MRAKLFVLFFAFASGGALAQAGLSTDAPIDIKADRVDGNINDKTIAYSGNVIVTQGDIRMHANTLSANSADGRTAEQIVANGNVVVDSPAVGTLTGDAGVWDVASRSVTFTGRVVLTKDRNVLRGNVMTVNLVTGQARLGMGNSGGRVQGLFAAPQSISRP